MTRQIALFWAWMNLSFLAGFAPSLAHGQAKAPRFAESGVIEKVVPGGCQIKFHNGQVIQAVLKDRSVVHVRAHCAIKDVPQGVPVAASGKLNPKTGELTEGIIEVLLFEEATPQRAFGEGSGVLSGEADANGGYLSRIIGTLVSQDPIVIQADPRNSTTTTVKLPNGRTRRVPTMAFGGKKFQVKPIATDGQVDIRLGSAVQFVDEGAYCTAFGAMSNPPVIDSLRVTRKAAFDFGAIAAPGKKKRGKNIKRPAGAAPRDGATKEKQ